MDIDPKEFRKLLKQTYAEWRESPISSKVSCQLRLNTRIAKGYALQTRHCKHYKPKKLFTSQHEACHMSNMNANVCPIIFRCLAIQPRGADWQCYLQVVHNQQMPLGHKLELPCDL
jgi:hypothetical protein